MINTLDNGILSLFMGIGESHPNHSMRPSVIVRLEVNLAHNRFIWCARNILWNWFSIGGVAPNIFVRRRHLPKLLLEIGAPSSMEGILALKAFVIVFFLLNKEGPGDGLILNYTFQLGIIVTTTSQTVPVKLQQQTKCVDSCCTVSGKWLIMCWVYFRHPIYRHLYKNTTLYAPILSIIDIYSA